jgi:phosphoribosylaminoimidazole (AIR) synthetase
MYEDFNMGVGADIIVDPEIAADAVFFPGDEFGIGAFQTGECARARGVNKLTLSSPHGSFEYRKSH